MPSTVITALASFAPPKILTNEDIEAMRPPTIQPEDWTNDVWIFPRTGIKERRIAPENWATSDLMVPAVQGALIDAGATIREIDLLITTTSFGDKGFNVPRTCDILKDKIGLPQNVLSLEENAECAGFGFALVRAQMEILVNGFKKVLVVSGDKTTAATNYKDRSTCILFGDVAGAVILEPYPEPGYGILAAIRGTDTRFIDCMDVPAGGSALPATAETVEQGLHYMRMPGGNRMLKEIGFHVFPELCQEVVKLAGISLEQVRHIIPHQANIRITAAGEEKLGLKGKGIIYKEAQKWYGNPSGSSVPLGLDLLYRDGRLEKGDYIILIAFGAGFTYCAVLLRWTKPKFQSMSLSKCV